MSRIANSPIEIPKGVEVSVNGNDVSVKGSKGSLNLVLHQSVEMQQEDSQLKFSSRAQSKQAGALAGTFRALVNNMVVGVSAGFEKQLVLQGVGYRAQVQGKALSLTLGFSHPVVYSIPEDVVIETPTQTQILVKGIDKQKVGQVSAEIRAFRPPEPYKGKGVRYSDEYVKRKDAKKK